MANYIDDEIFCEAYSHLEINLFNDKEALKKLKAHLTSYYLERAEYVFGEGVKIEIEFEEGSLITKLKVIGSTALTIYGLMANYGGFSQTVQSLSKESMVLAQSANFELAFRTKAAYCDKITVEKRRGVFGRVDELIGELDLIRKGVAHSNVPTTYKAIEEFEIHVEHLNRWHSKAIKMLGKLENNESKACISAGLLEELEKFPSNVPWENELKQQSFRSQIVKSDPDLAGRVAGVAKRVEENVKYIRQCFKDTVEQYAAISS